MYCIICGKLMANTATKCPNCGADAPSPEELSQPPSVPLGPAALQAPYVRYGLPEPNGMATASLVLGILALCSGGVLGIVGLILGIIGLRRANASGGTIGGKGLAIAGIVTSVVSFSWALMLAAFMVPSFSRARTSAIGVTCTSNLKQLALAAEMYAMDYDGHLPLADNWSEALQPYVPNPALFNCPDATSEGYAYNRELSGLPTAWARAGSNTPLLFDGADGASSSGGAELVELRHSGRATVALLRGRTSTMTDSEVRALDWGPYEAPRPWEESIDLEDFEFEPLEGPLEARPQAAVGEAAK